MLAGAPSVLATSGQGENAAPARKTQVRAKQQQQLPGRVSVVPELAVGKAEDAAAGLAPPGLRWDSRLCALHGTRTRIPDTVLFREGKPARWLFTSQKTGVVLAKKRARLNETDILRVFGRTARGGFVAVARSRVPGRERLRVEFLRTHQVLDLLQDEKQLRALESLQVCAGLHSEPGFAAYEVCYITGARPLVWRVTDDKRVLGAKADRSSGYEAALERIRGKASQQREVYRKHDEVRVASQAKASNETLTAAARDLLRGLELRLGRGRVAKLVTEYIETRDAGIVLTHVVSLELAGGPISDADFARQLGMDRGIDSESASSGRSSGRSSIASGLDGDSAQETCRAGAGPAGGNQQRPARPWEPKDLSAILAGPRRGQQECWGQYCAQGAHEPVMSGKQVLLAAIARAAARRVELRREGIGFHISGFASAQDEEAQKNLAGLRDQLSRLYRPVTVCDGCFAAYRYLHESRAGWDLTGDIASIEPDCIPGMSKNSLAQALGHERNVKLYETKSSLARSFFACDRHGVTGTPRSGCCARCNRACFELAAQAKPEGATDHDALAGGATRIEAASGQPLREVVHALARSWGILDDDDSDDDAHVARNARDKAPRRAKLAAASSVPPPPSCPPPAHILRRRDARARQDSQDGTPQHSAKPSSATKSASKGPTKFELLQQPLGEEQASSLARERVEAPVKKSHRVQRLQQMLSSAVSQAQGWHPPLIAVRRKSYIPATPTSVPR